MTTPSPGEHAPEFAFIEDLIVENVNKNVEVINH